MMATVLDFFIEYHVKFFRVVETERRLENNSFCADKADLL